MPLKYNRVKLGVGNIKTIYKPIVSRVGGGNGNNIKSKIWEGRRRTVKKKQTISETKLSKSITNKNYYNWRQYKTYNYYSVINNF